MSEKNNRPSCQRGPSGNARPSRRTSVEGTIGTVLVRSLRRIDAVELQKVRRFGTARAKAMADRGEPRYTSPKEMKTRDAALGANGNQPRASSILRGASSFLPRFCR